MHCFAQGLRRVQVFFSFILCSDRKFQFSALRTSSSQPLEQRRCEVLNRSEHSNQSFSHLDPSEADCSFYSCSWIRWNLSVKSTRQFKERKSFYSFSPSSISTAFSLKLVRKINKSIFYHILFVSESKTQWNGARKFELSLSRRPRAFKRLTKVKFAKLWIV